MDTLYRYFCVVYQSLSNIVSKKISSVSLAIFTDIFEDTKRQVFSWWCQAKSLFFFQSQFFRSACDVIQRIKKSRLSIVYNKRGLKSPEICVTIHSGSMSVLETSSPQWQQNAKKQFSWLFVY